MSSGYWLPVTGFYRSKFTLLFYFSIYDVTKVLYNCFLVVVLLLFLTNCGFGAHFYSRLVVFLTGCFGDCDGLRGKVYIEMCVVRLFVSFVFVVLGVGRLCFF